ncbi:myxosortase-dependent M36 family metallopeptidase [Archangium lansingense]|uniref:Myxosortase-dependent M36 family metallopeptidase n=1 Tax=Archangium lansingense TaxID=2995310 RepID=A0ABT4ACI5_9BACT|nr:myxosortase-dependent M36 family metallopeptidase [Archangium lansinium]MCY1078934.1 myxosortase-dependent M36 family metallopeptidase [Archangium lansinium]
MRLRQTLWAGLLLTPLASGSALAASRGNYDAFLARQEEKSLTAKEEALHARGLRVSQMEDRLGVPSFVWNTRASSSTNQAVSSKMLGARKPEQAARAHLQSVADLYRLGSEDVSGAVLKGMHQTGRGPVIARFTQQVDGIEVFRNEVKVVMDRNLEMVAVSGYLAPAQSARKASLGAASAFKLSADQAIAIAFQDQTGISMPARGFVSNGQVNGPYSHYVLDSSSASVLTHSLVVPARAKRIYYTMPDGLEPAWYVEVNTGLKNTTGSDYHSFVVSAVNGALLMRNNLSAHAGTTSYRYKVWADTTAPYTPYDGPHGNDTTPYASGTPDGVDVRLDLPPNYVTLSSLPGNDPWLPAGATETVGNNVDAYADLSTPDGFQPGSNDLRAAVNGEAATPGFDYLYDLSKAPNFDITQRQAAVTNLFYVTNWLHDSFYAAGFDEASGNAQASNFGRGGVEGDRMRAEAQDYDSTNNANMFTPADGAPPRMQMYVFSPVSRFTLDVNTPTGLTVTPGPADFGDQDFDLTNDVVVALQGTATTGCGTTPFTNAAELSGKIALIDRGICAFTEKAKNAQNAGAAAVILANNQPGGIAPSGTDASITIPVVAIRQADGNAFKEALKAGPVNVRMVKLKPTEARDGTLDNAIVAHEWGHYISNRLIGDGNGLNNYQGGAMGEGWGDFHALMMQVREADRNVAGNNQFQGVYSMSAYVTSGPGVPGAYYGIRRVPYSTSFSKNALTFKHIANGNPLPDTHPLSFGHEGRANSEVHNGGEVWAAMLWDCYVSLLNAHPFQVAEDRMKQYLVAAYKATPSSPTYIEARDALLSVTKASDPADYQRFAAAFARRGMGFGAKAPDRDSQDFVGLVESYQAGNNLEVVSIKLDDTITGCDQDGVLDVGEKGYLTVTVRNVGEGALASFNATVAASGASANLAFTSGNVLNFSSLAPMQTATRKLPIELLQTTGAEPRAGLTLTFDEPSLPTAVTTASFNGRVNTDESAGTSDTDTVEAQTTSWTSSVIGNGPSQPWQRVEANGNRFWHGRNLPFTGDVTLTSPWVEARADADFIFRYKYRHSFETDNGGGEPFFDGAIVEFTTDGLEWHNVFDSGVDPGYTNFIGDGSFSNPLDGQPGYAGLSADFPDFETAELDFGTQFAGKHVQFRFRLGSDPGAGAHGLDVDDLQFSGIDPSQLPFGGTLREAFEGPAGDPSAPACNRRPVANAGKTPQTVANFRVDASGTVKTYNTVKLDGSGSFDSDGEALTYTWTQLSGPPVTLTDANTARPTFTPRVENNATFVFQLVVSDSKESSLPVNATAYVLTDHDPVANAGADNRVPSRGVVTLSGSVVDPDGDPVTFVQWVQEDGPAVTLKDDGALTTTFTAPDVKEDTELVFTLYAATASLTIGTELLVWDTVKLTVHKSNRHPVVKGPNDMTVAERTAISLDAEGTDADEDVLSYTWVQTGGTIVQLSGADTAKLSFTTPEVKGDTLMTFRLLAKDSNGDESEAVTVNLTVTNANRGPTALARKISGGSVAGDNVTLDGSGSTDPDGDALTYQWTQVSGPSVTLSPADGSYTNFVSPKAKDGATLVFELTVSDGTESAKHQVTVEVPKEAGGCSSTGSGQSSMVSMLLIGAGLLFSRRRSLGRG